VYVSAVSKMSRIAKSGTIRTNKPLKVPHSSCRNMFVGIAKILNVCSGR